MNRQKKEELKTQKQQGDHSQIGQQQQGQNPTPGQQTQQPEQGRQKSGQQKQEAFRPTDTD